MYLKTLYLRHFRCFEEASFEFHDGINVVVGGNARGKTTILEAIHFLSTGRSFRTTQIRDLIRIGTESFHVEAHFVKHGVLQTLKIICNGKDKEITYNHTKYSSWSQLLGLLPGVVMTPDDVALVKGSPQVRRQFLDLQIAQANPLYVHHLTRYHRAMRQRNALLKAKQSHSIDSWEHEMAQSGAFLVQQRLLAAAELQREGERFYRELSGEKDALSLAYRSPSQDLESIRQYYLNKWRQLRPREMALGFTLSGPHKDDLSILLGKNEVRFFASEGQQRSCIAALKLAEWQRLHSLCDGPPLTFMDDLGISLDSLRQQKLLQQLPSLGQVFVSTTHSLAMNANEIMI